MFRQHLRRFFIEVLRQPVRSFLLISGLAFITWGITLSEGPKMTLVISVGLVLMLTGALLPAIKNIHFSAPGVKLDVEGHEAEVATSTTLAMVSDSAELERILQEIASTDDDPPTRSSQDSEVDAALDVFVANKVIPALLSPDGTGPLSDARFHLYLYDPIEDQLSPILDPVASTTASWRPGRGVVGCSYAENRYIVAEGLACSDGTFGLTEEEQHRYRDVEVVVAVPVTDNNNNVLGVLSAASDDPESQLGVGATKTLMIVRALTTSRVLTGVLQWYPE